MQNKNLSGLVDVGIDIEETSRFENVDANFLKKNFTASEIRYCLEKTKPHIHFAGIFCAKEAVRKTYHKAISFKSIEVSHEKSGKPKVSIKNKNRNYIVSISHTKDVAIAIILKQGVKNADSKRSNNKITRRKKI
jgi:phosphopantetheine--protein transferase-like protein